MEAASPLLTVPNGLLTTVQAAYICPNCQRINIATESQDGLATSPTRAPKEKAQDREWGQSASWLPKLGTSREFPDVPEQIAGAAAEATLCWSMGAYRAVGSLARAVIEATAKDKDAGGSHLAARIDALASAGYIREHTKEQAHEIRHFGNDMAHGDFAGPVDEEEAAEVIELMSEVLNEVYQSPARLGRVRQARMAKRNG